MNSIYKVVREFRILDNKGLFQALDFCKNNNGDSVYIIYSKSNINNWREQNKGEALNDVLVSKNVLDFLDKQIGDFEKEILEFSQSIYFKNMFPDIKLSFIILETNSSVKDIYDFALQNNVKKIFTDYASLREQRKFFDNFTQKINKEESKSLEIEEIDSRNIFDIVKVSDKEEFAASTFRRKWVRILKEEDLQESIKKYFETNKELLSLESFKRGQSYKIFEEFLNNKLENYFEDRNNGNLSGQSGISPFINIGRISRIYVLYFILKNFNLKVEDIFSENKNGSGENNKEDIDEEIIFKSNRKLNKEKLLSIRSFVEEFFIRYELAENYCYYNKNYDNILGIKDWAKKTLDKANGDKREYIYSKKDFENCKTHDDLWNACQKDLVYNGRLNGYLRMYWAKKILQWSISAEEAIKIAVYLNDKYALDGYAPPSYTGILWSIGGLHDRAWFPRPIFGNIRYMAISGVEKRMNVKEYIKKVNYQKML